MTFSPGPLQHGLSTKKCPSGLVYGYTPPTVIAVDPDMLTDAGSFASVAAGLAAELQRRPIWVVVKASEDITLSADPAMAAEACLRVPADLPSDLDDAAAAILQRHMEDLGALLPIEAVPTGPTPHSPASAIVAGTWRDAVGIARMAGAADVLGWTLEPEWLPEEVDGVPITPGRPDTAVAAQ